VIARLSRSSSFLKSETIFVRSKVRCLLLLVSMISTEALLSFNVLRIIAEPNMCFRLACVVNRYETRSYN